MDERQLERFVDVVESGSLSRTSNRLNISQPALSKSLRLLEEQLGIKLLERGPRGVKLTKFGDVFYRRARSIASQFRRAREDLGELKGSAAGRCRSAPRRALVSSTELCPTRSGASPPSVPGYA